MTQTAADDASSPVPEPGLPVVLDRPVQPYAAIRRRVTMAELATSLPPLNQQVFDWLAAQGAEPDGPPFWRYLVIDMATTLEIDVGVGTTTLLAGDGDVHTGQLPAGRYATLRHTGHPDGLMEVTGDLLRWADEQQLRLDHHPTPDGDAWGCRLELYLTDPDEQPDLDQWVTELAFRLAD